MELYNNYFTEQLINHQIKNNINSIENIKDKYYQNNTS